MKSKKHKSPNIYRFIPAKLRKELSRLDRKEVFGAYSKALNVFTLIIFIVAIIILGYDLYGNIKDREKIDLERANIAKEISFWQSFLEKNRDYRDGYLRLAILEYQLRNVNNAKIYLNKALEIDPNFEKTKELEKVLNIK